MSIFQWFKKRNKKETYVCPDCGQQHEGLPALGFAEPFPYSALSDEEKQSIADIDDDFCVIRYPEQTDRFIRVTLTIPVNDACEDFDYGLWVSLSEKSFEDYKADFLNSEEGKVYFGTICNHLPGYELSTIRLHVNVNTRAGNQRPLLVPHEGEHQLIADWEQGISWEEARRRIALCQP
ncbi:MAG: DUF2199 domain-containing protein [Chitinophagaceae bacterium]|nr:MAG: DUF2199 domain-containing protein [Chitinophagaceae bacterium]